MAFRQRIFMNLTTTEAHYMETIYTKFNQNSSRNMDSMVKNSFMLYSKA